MPINTEEVKIVSNEQTIENIKNAVHKIHQELYDNCPIIISAEQKMRLFAGFIFAGMAHIRVEDLIGRDSTSNRSDGNILYSGIKDIIEDKINANNITTIESYLKPLFTDPNAVMARKISEDSPVTYYKHYYSLVKDNLIDFIINQNRGIDVMSVIYNELTSWITIGGDEANDVVLTPNCVINLINDCLKIDRDTYYAEPACGCAPFALDALRRMLNDAREHIMDPDKQREKTEKIKTEQITAIELRDDLFMLALLNFALYDSGRENIVCGDVLRQEDKLWQGITAAGCNPPYSLEGNGICLAVPALTKMGRGMFGIIIQSSTGSGRDGGFAKQILAKSTLRASITMSPELFIGKAGVQTNVYIFETNRPHQKSDLVKFINMSNDGYERSGRKKSKNTIKNKDHAEERYAEVAALVNGQCRNPIYYTENNGLYVEDTIGLEGADWNISSHNKNETKIEERDFYEILIDVKIFDTSIEIRKYYD